MSIIRKSTRLENRERLRNIFTKFLIDVRFFINVCQTSNISPRCRESNKLYRMVTLHFYDLYNYLGCHVNKFFYTLYDVSFRYLRDMVELKDHKSLQLLKKTIIPYRKVYEKYREESWSTNQWSRYLSRDILNIISSYVY